MKIGLGDIIITPPLETPMAGYYYPRMPRGVHDDLHAKTLVVDDGESQVALVACDLVMVSREVVERARRRIQHEHKIPSDHILICANHSHTGPIVTSQYANLLIRWIVESMETALLRKVDASLFVGNQNEARLAYNRRYLMKDGTVETNPGFLNPNVAKPVGLIDPRVGVLRAVEGSGRPLMTWVNYAMHQDTVGGDLISADYSYYLARTLSQVEEPDLLTIFMMGSAGNINHWDISKPGPQRGFDTAERIGTVLANDVLEACEKLEAVPGGPIRAVSETIDLPLQNVTPSETAESRRLLEALPPPDVDFTLDRVKAKRTVTIAERKGKFLCMEIQIISIGSVAFVGIPGEPFVELGLQIVKESPFRDTYVVELANDNIGYIPTERAFKEGGYEPTSSILAPGDGEMIADTAVKLLKRIKAVS